MEARSHTIYLDFEAATERLAQCFAPLLGPGDCVLLAGPIGAGKTHFCRAFIRARLARTEDVPSPTFTLVQTYDADVEIWHADLYRLTHPDEARELGLEEAFERAICLVEWPDRLGGAAPAGAIRIELSPQGAGRKAKIRLGDRPDLLAALTAAFPDMQRITACERMLAAAGWDGARREALAGDASARRYERLTLGRQSRILMDAPKGVDDVAAFARIDRHLQDIGLTAPMIFAEDLQAGFLLIEDFGDGVFSRQIAADPVLDEPLYRAAVEVLVHLRSCLPALGIADLSARDWATSAGLVLEWYRFALTGDTGDMAPFVNILADLLARYADGPKVMILRDYHAENLMWLPERQGVRRVGLLDFQLAQMGQDGYDLVSLLQDARRDVAPKVEQAMIRHFLNLTGQNEAGFMPRYAVLGALRALRILGIFARLCLVTGKPAYVALMPRVWQHLARNLARPELAGLRDVCDRLLPPPDPAAMERIRGQCGNFQ